MACNVNLYADIPHCVGEVSLPGTQNRILMIRRADIATWANTDDPGDTTASLNTVVTMDDNFTLAADAGWLVLDLVPDVNSFSSESQGSWGSKTFLNTVNAVMPGVGKKVSGFCRMVNNDDVVFLVPDREGKYRLFGNEMFQCEVSIKQESGAAATDSAQTTLEIKVTDVCPPPYYEGTVTIKSASASSGS